MAACGLDFGTSNSTIGVLSQGIPNLVPLEDGSPLIPSAIFFDYESRGQVNFGRAAIQSYIEQNEGRLMRALKSILSSPLIEQKTVIGGKLVSLKYVVELFVQHLKQKAETLLDDEVTAVVHGRPVRFVDGNDFADMQAQLVLEEIARKLGFRHIEFLYEPIAAAYHFEQYLTQEEVVLVADIGGGTSDFSVIRLGPARRHRPDRKPDILSSQGARIGGVDFDAALSLSRVMPEFGLGSRLRTKKLPMPNAIYFELANWATINFVYTPQYAREVRDAIMDAEEPDKLRRLQSLISLRLGHRIATAVEDAKIDLSQESQGKILLDFVEPSLSLGIGRATFDQILEPGLVRIVEGVKSAIRVAGLTSSEVHTVFLTGGSSRIPAIRAAIASAAPNAELRTSSDLLSVGLGLTEHAANIFGSSSSAGYGNAGRVS